MNTRDQFGGLDNPSDRRWLMAMFNRLCRGVSEEEGQARCGLAVQQLLAGARSPVVKGGARATPMSPGEAFAAFAGITGVLGLPAEAGALALEEMLR